MRWGRAGAEILLIVICVGLLGIPLVRGEEDEEDFPVEIRDCRIGGVRIGGLTSEFYRKWGGPNQLIDSSKGQTEAKDLDYYKYGVLIHSINGRLVHYSLVLKRHDLPSGPQMPLRCEIEHGAQFDAVRAALGVPDHIEQGEHWGHYVYQFKGCCVVITTIRPTGGPAFAFEVDGIAYDVFKEKTENSAAYYDECTSGRANGHGEGPVKK